MKYSFVIPCYNSSMTISEVVEQTAQEMKHMGREDFEFVLVNDCSPDGGKTIQKLSELSRTYDFVKVIDLAKNAGQHNAIMAGLNYSSGDVIIGMDDDMQTHPSQLGKLFDEFEKGYDIVYGYYPEKKHSMFRNLGSRFNHFTVRLLIGKPKELKTSSYWVIRRFIRDNVIQYQSPYTYLQGLFLRTTQNIASVPIQHFKREVGQSNYTFRKLVQLWGNILGFSIVPLRLSVWCGYLFSGVGLIGAITILIKKILNPAMALGWPSLMVVICFFSGIILLFLGLIGEYIGRMFLQIGRQPQYVVRQVLQKEDDKKIEGE